MIFRRFSEHFASQNWFAVGLDILVVITGIFLGLQVSEWNETRKERVEERAYLGRLVTEIRETRDANTKVAENGIEKLAMIGNAVTLLQSGLLTEHNMDDFQNYVYATHFYPRAKIYDSVINEMVASGKVGLIKNAEIRSIIVTYSETVQGAKNINEGHFSEFLKLRHAIHEQIKLPIDYDSSHKILDTPAEISKNRSFLGTIRFAHELLSEQIYGVEEFRDKASDMLTMLNEYSP